MVYAGLAQHAGGRIMLMAPKLNYLNSLPLLGWREHDRNAGYRIVRQNLLRTPITGPAGLNPGQKFLFRVHDICIRSSILIRIALILWRSSIKIICIGELVPSGWILSVLRWWPGITRVIYVHGEEITTSDRYDADGARRRAILSAADLVIAVSPFTADAVKAMMRGAERPRILLIENGVDTEKFTPAPRRPDLLVRYNLSGYFVYISVCRLLEKKGIDHSLRAFADIHQADPETRFLIVGTGPYAQTLESIAASLGIAPYVIFAGDVTDDELVDHYRLGDVFIMPNRALPDGDTEGFGLVFLEANAVGLPVIAGRDGGSVAAVEHDYNGLVVDGHSIAAITGAMQRLRQDDALRLRLAAGGRERAKAMDWRTKTDQFLAACQTAAHG